MIDGITIGAAVGGAVAVGYMFRFLNVKIDKKQEEIDRKQDKVMCERIAQSFEKAIDRSDAKHQETMTILNQIQITAGKIEQRILNGG
ncbi:MAG: hypothetical protein MIO92_09820 [Methanosarcinaceae archaeon]|nr:hypothetical protein [Methanosarcinaceae archaeon]